MAGFSWFNFHSDIENRLQFREAKLQTSINSAIEGYKNVVSVMLYSEINTPELKQLIKAFNEAPVQRQQRLRGKLYRRLYAFYQILFNHDIRVLQLVSPKGYSILRINRPELYGDKISNDRSILGQVITTHKPAQGFENGRAYPGFHYAFPLLSEGELIAIIDFSVPFDALKAVAAETCHENSGCSRIMMYRELLERTVHPSAKGLFLADPISDNYVSEDVASPLRDIKKSFITPSWQAAVDARLKRDYTLQRAIADGDNYSTFLCRDLDQCFSVVMLPVRDSKKRLAAYIVSYYPDAEYTQLLLHYATNLLIACLLLALVTVVVHIWFNTRRYMHIISENMAEGLYVVNEHGHTKYINKAFTRILGYSAKECLETNAHELFHVHTSDQPVSQDGCQIRNVPLNGEIYQSEYETFRHKDGSLIRVKVTSSPLLIEHKISGAVVLFGDYTQEFQAKKRLQQSDTALHNLAEGVIITDPQANIIAVNRAFTSITGYSEAEILGKNPTCLSSGRHDRDFYKRMWSDLEHENFWEGEIWNRRSNNDIYPEWLKITKMLGDNGENAGYVGVFSDISEQLSKEKKLTSLAYHDQLTGLLNRTAFMEIFEHALNRSARQKSQVALFFMDLDRFKRINDTLGHDIGDVLLQEVALRLKNSVRIDNEVGRMGGDEFVLMLEDFKTLNTPALIAKKVINVIKEPFYVKDKILHVTTSIGISIFPRDGEDSQTLLKNADAAMYMAKNFGRNGYHFFTRSLAREARERFELELELQQALKKHQFVVFYQPKISLHTGEIIGLEALIRWQHPSRGLLAPNAFLEVMIEAGFISEMTLWQLGEVTRQHSLWSASGYDVGRVAINIDGNNISADMLNSMLENVMNKESTDPSILELEILETSLNQEEFPDAFWNDLVERGFELAIDDFGTGESSLLRLSKLPVSTLKVDRSFISDLQTNENAHEIVKSIIALGKTMNKKVLAEGVETAEQLGFLIQAECDEVQGYYFSRPVTAEQITHLLDDNNFAVLLRQQRELHAAL